MFDRLEGSRLADVNLCARDVTAMHLIIALHMFAGPVHSSMSEKFKTKGVTPWPTFYVTKSWPHLMRARISGGRAPRYRVNYVRS